MVVFLLIFVLTLRRRALDTLKLSQIVPGKEKSNAFVVAHLLSEKCGNLEGLAKKPLAVIILKISRRQSAKHYYSWSDQVAVRNIP